MPNKYFGASQDALRMMIPLVINRRNIEANAAEQEKRIGALREQSEAQLLRDLYKQKAEEDRAQKKAQAEMILKRFEAAEAAGDRTTFEALAPLVEQQMGVPLSKFFSSPEGVDRYNMIPPKPQDPSYDIRDTEQGIMAFDRRNPQAPPISTGVQGKQQKWEVYPPGAGGDTKDPISRTVDLGDKVRVFKRDGSFEDLPKNPSPTATEQSTRPPKGYRWNENKELEAIPGGPADEKTQIKYAQERASTESTVSELDRLQDQARQLMTHPGLGRITGIMGIMPNMPGSEASNAEAMLETLKSQTAFSVLQAMRNASKTGGALGQVSDKEGELLQNNLAALGKAQSYDAYRKSLQKIIDYTENAKNRISGVFDSTWKDRESPRKPQEWREENLQLKTADDYLNKKFGQ